MWPWYVYVILSVVILFCTIGFPIIDHILATKEYKEKTMKDNEVLNMMLDGWCDDCDGDPAQCALAGRCMYENDDETEDEDGSKEKSV